MAKKPGTKKDAVKKSSAKRAADVEERNILIRPDRLKYVQKMDRPKGCVFCEAATTKDREKKLVLYRSKHAMVVLNKYPYNNGHILIMPTEHKGNLEDLKDKAYDEIQQLLRHAVVILKKVYKCGGLNVGLNLGADAGAGIPDHLHYHVIPRWYGDTNFFPLIAKTKLVMETPEATLKNLRKPFSALEGKL
jgi:ATP adenylyltransferase